MPGPIRRRAEQRADDLQLALFDGNLDADAAELALDAGLEAVELVGAM